ncbi:hypothetical protein HF329_27700 [Chitinophaga oryzae]|uniref:Uncharacterized protein n=1 Tax=Chitinophaga oryzae TaxID=2725414 RepID=A0AAE6ZMJ2_9BACT|nr:hypothetical protein [Chitinophaga oryzae]QJB34883.1 hypothetical protein HF329_27700 [Chitinophaga oryzae]
MEERAINDLLKYLEQKGFRGKKLEEDLRSRINSDLPEFSTDHQIVFNHQEELVINYRLNFKKNHQVNGYLFDRYQTSCTIPPKIKNSQYGSINAVEFDRQMFKVHWGRYFKGGAVAGVDNKSMAQQCINRLNELLQSNEIDKIDFARTMMFKYWPKEQLNPEWSGTYESRFQRKRDYNSQLHANLVYHLLTGELDALYEKIRSMGLDLIAGSDLYSALCDHLQSIPEEFVLKTDFFQPDGKGTISLTIANSWNEYTIKELEIQRVQYPPLPHGTYNGVDSAELEAHMDRINWRNADHLCRLTEDGRAEFKLEIKSICQRIDLLQQDAAGQATGDLLSLKYWCGSPVMADAIRNKAWQLLDILPEKRMKFPTSIDLRAAVNLMAGRPVMAHLIETNLEACDQWIKLNENLGQDAKYTYFSGPTVEEIQSLICSLPLVPDDNRPSMNTELIRGNIVGAVHKNERPIRIEADPEHRTLKIFSTDGRLIPVNINFDPDWKPPSQFLEKLLKATHTNKRMPGKMKPRNSGLHRS